MSSESKQQKQIYKKKVYRNQRHCIKETLSSHSLGNVHCLNIVEKSEKRKNIETKMNQTEFTSLPAPREAN